MGLLINKKEKGASLIEILLALSLLIVIMTLYVGIIISGQEESAISSAHLKASALAREGIEAVRNIRDEDFNSIITGTHGLRVSGDEWGFFGSSDVTNNFTREISVSLIDANTKEITSTVTWAKNARRDGEVNLTTRLSNWSEITAFNSCNDYAISQGYSSGTCRQNAQQCGKNDEVYDSEGDQYCTGGASADTCCVAP